MSEYASPYHPLIFEAFNEGKSFALEFLGDTPHWQIHGLDFSYDVAKLIALDTVYKGEKQSVSLAFLLRVLSGDKLPPLAYRYVCRWYDENGVAHYFGVYAKEPTIEQAKANIKFNLIDVPVDIVYAPIDENDLYNYLEDVKNTNPDNPNGLSDVGSIDWIE